MNRSCMVAAFLAACFALPAEATVFNGFTGPYGPAGWTTLVTGNLTGAAGGSMFLSATALSITGGNAISPDPGNFVPACTGSVTGVVGPCQISFVTTQAPGAFSFDWLYASSDSAGAGDDLFGILIDGVRTQLSDPGGAIGQSGHASVNAGSSFGWYVNCTDCLEGAATARITNFQVAVVPEAGTMALLGLGVAAVGIARRRRGRKDGGQGSSLAV